MTDEEIIKRLRHDDFEIAGTLIGAIILSIIMSPLFFIYIIVGGVVGLISGVISSARIWGSHMKMIWTTPEK